MNLRMEWVSVAVVTVIMSGVVGYAAWNTYGREHTLAVRPTVSDVVGGNPNWKESLVGVLPVAQTVGSSSGPYRAPTGLTPTEKIGREILTGYYEAKAGGFTDAERASLVSGIAARNITNVEPARTYAATDITADASVGVGVYAGALITTLKTSDSIREYEADTFNTTISSGNVRGTPKLLVAAATYQSIERTLAEMRVPPALVAEHVAVLNGVALLAESTKLMGMWGGEPTLGLAYLDAFIRADRATNVVVTQLFYSINKALSKNKS